MELQRRGRPAEEIDMNDAQFEALLSRLDRIAAALERLAPAASRETAAPETAAPDPGAQPTPVACTESAAEPLTLIPEAIRGFLDSRSIRVRRVPPPSPADPVLDKLALFLGQRYFALRNALEWMKRTMQTAGRWHLKLAGRPQEEISACTQFCHRLHELAFLTEYRYYRAPRCLVEARTSTAPEAQAFLSGQWLERFVRQEVERAAADAQTKSLAMLANVQVILPNNDDFELDLLVAMDGSLSWIESKTGAYQSYVRKYSRMAQLLGLGPSRSFLVLAAVPPAVCGDLSRMTGMTVCRPEDFHASFLQSTPLSNPEIPAIRAGATVL